jgi:hypothetical protein
MPFILRLAMHVCSCAAEILIASSYSCMEGIYRLVPAVDAGGAVSGLVIKSEASAAAGSARNELWFGFGALIFLFFLFFLFRHSWVGPQVIYL